MTVIVDVVNEAPTRRLLPKLGKPPIPPMITEESLFPRELLLGHSQFLVVPLDPCRVKRDLRLETVQRVYGIRVARLDFMTAGILRNQAGVQSVELRCALQVDLALFSAI